MAQEIPVDKMTDLQFVDHYIEECSQFISPILFRELRSRGLYDIVNLLSGNMQERKAIARARMAHADYYLGEPEIEQIASHIDRIKFLRDAIYNTSPTDVIQLIKLMDDMKVHTEFVRDYLKETKLPS